MTTPNRFANAGDIREAKQTMWSSANRGFTKKDRDAFNSWRDHLHKLAVGLNDEAHGLPDEARYSKLCRLAAAIEKMTGDIPVMFNRTCNLGD